MNTPEEFGEFLRSKARYAKNTSERLGQASRVDAVCWYLSKVQLASAREVKRFVTAFKGGLCTYSCYNRRTRQHSLVKDLERCYALLNICYGGVGRDIHGTMYHQSGHYGDVAPLWRPQPRHYACTIPGMARAARVSALIGEP